MRKTLFIIPGFTESASDPQYQKISKLYKSKGYLVKGVKISWKYRVMTDYVEEFSGYFQQHKTSKNYIFGFSFGAMIALISANELKPDGIILCSLSPYFQEDLKYFKKWWRKEIGENRLKDFNKYNAAKIAKGVKINAKIFYGTAEGKKFPQLKFRCEETAKCVPGAKLVVVEGAPHDLDHPAYIEAVKNSIKYE